MCGIVGLYLKNNKYESQLGALFEPMLTAMTDRGPDSAGFAIYGDDTGDDGRLKVTLRHPDALFDWEQLTSDISTTFGEAWCESHSGCDHDSGSANHASVATLKVKTTEADIREWLSGNDPRLLILSVGSSIEILKEVGLPEDIAAKFDLSSMTGTHIIGHTRMATESAVTMEGSHPFSTGSDLCLVHNGSLSNHNRLRASLQREGIRFETDNDSEVAAGYLTWRLNCGDSLQASLENALQDLDGFFTFAIGTKDGFAVMRDPIACKPAVLAETADYVAMASEYQALTTLPGIEEATVWEPEPATFYIWERHASGGLS